MFVVGIDPGLSRCGYGVLAAERDGPQLVAMGVLRTPASDEIPDRLVALADDIRDLLVDYPASAVAVERVLFQVNTRTAIGVAQASGIVMAEARRCGAVVVEYSPNTVKQCVAGDGAADKTQMELMVRRMLRISTPIRPVDAADALGVALCHLAHAPLAARLRASAGGAS